MTIITTEEHFIGMIMKMPFFRYFFTHQETGEGQ